MNLPVQLLNEHATVPTYGSASAAGMDLYANFHGDAQLRKPSPEGHAKMIAPGERYLIKTGISVAIPEGYYGRVAPRSGLAYKNGFDVLAGVVDSDYRGDVGVILINLGDKAVPVSHGDRIAQFVIEKIGRFEPEVVDSLDDTVRSAGGFGSTGK